MQSSYHQAVEYHERRRALKSGDKPCRRKLRNIILAADVSEEPLSMFGHIPSPLQSRTQTQIEASNNCSSPFH